MAAKQAKGGGAKKHGRNKDKCAQYRAMHVREKNKIGRVLQSSGLAAAKAYASKHNLTTFLGALVKRRGLTE